MNVDIPRFGGTPTLGKQHGPHPLTLAPQTSMPGAQTKLPTRPSLPDAGATHQVPRRGIPRTREGALDRPRLRLLLRQTQKSHATYREAMRPLHTARSSNATRAPLSIDDEHFCRREQRPAWRGLVTASRRVERCEYRERAGGVACSALLRPVRLREWQVSIRWLVLARKLDAWCHVATSDCSVASATQFSCARPQWETPGLSAARSPASMRVSGRLARAAFPQRQRRPGAPVRARSSRGSR